MPPFLLGNTMAKKQKEKAENGVKCRLLTALATMYGNYKAGDIYQDTPETIERLIVRGMAESLE